MFSIDLPVGGAESGALRAVVADDDPAQRALLVRHLTERGYAVAEAADGDRALALIGEQEPALALLCRSMAPYDGDRVAAVARIVCPHTRIILTGGRAEPACDGALPVLPRPVDLEQLDRCLAEAG
ncbi:response regulator [Azospirillum sp. ST 5-10]|uniref:response regulator n=1 Tax=unclassified Azospirillum TaxID=2630922 RepID=UPI003F4A3384